MPIAVINNYWPDEAFSDAVRRICLPIGLLQNERVLWPKNIFRISWKRQRKTKKHISFCSDREKERRFFYHGFQLSLQFWIRTCRWFHGNYRYTDRSSWRKCKFPLPFALFISQWNMTNVHVELLPTYTHTNTHTFTHSLLITVCVHQSSAKCAGTSKHCNTEIL